MVLAGGGIQTGQVIGEFDKTGAYPKLRHVTPTDIHATVFEALGYDAQRISYRISEDRPMAVSDCHVVKGLL